MPKITKQGVDAFIAGRDSKDAFLWDAGDGALKGFGVRLKPSGVASYLAQYRNKEGRTRRIVLAKVGTATPAEARMMARACLAQVAKGGDPSAERKTTREGLTVAQLCALYLSAAPEWVKASTLAMDRSRIDTHVIPTIGKLRVSGLNANDINGMKAAILAGKTAKPERKGRGGLARGGPGVAARTIGMLGTILEYARSTLKIIKENPARGIKKPTDGRQRRFLTLDEIKGLGDVIRAAEEHVANNTAAAAVRLLLLTGFRRVEALALRPEWIDARAKCVRFPDTKSGYQIRPIGAPATELLASRAKVGSPWIFPADRGDGHFIGLPKALDRLCAKAGLAGVTVHVLRHSFAAVAAEMG